ncbi:hypothetical protein CsSME_00050853 [Camellia sinensis var. sinensis]
MSDDQSRPITQKPNEPSPTSWHSIMLLTASAIGAALLFLSGVNLNRESDIPGHRYPGFDLVQPNTIPNWDNNILGHRRILVFRQLQRGSGSGSGSGIGVVVQLHYGKTAAWGGGGATRLCEDEDC